MKSFYLGHNSVFALSCIKAVPVVALPSLCLSVCGSVPGVSGVLMTRLDLTLRSGNRDNRPLRFVASAILS